MDFNFEVEKEVVDLGFQFSYDVIIIGGGVAGISALLMATERGLNALLIEEAILCGELFNVPIIEDFPFLVNKRISGKEIVDIFSRLVDRNHLNVTYESVLDVDFFEGAKKKIVTNKHIYYSSSVIIASGAKNVKRKIPNAEQFLGRGVSYSATGDVVYYMHRDVAVLGNTEIAVKTALYISNFVKNIHLVTEKSLLQTSPFVLQEVMENKKINLLLRHEIISLDGLDSLEQMSLKCLESENLISIDVSCLFVYAEFQGNIDYLEKYKTSFNLTDTFFFNANKLQETDIPGIYVIGAVCDSPIRRIVGSVSEALIAVNEIQNYLYFLEKK